MIFPGLSDSRDSFVPIWKDAGAPWSILEDGPGGIKGQIESFLEVGSEIFIHPSAIIGESVTIEGPSYIGPDVEIRHGAYLRKGSWICEGSVVGHCSEIKNSVLLPGSKAPHFNYVGDSIVGMGANLGSGVKLSNVRNDKRGVLVELEDGSRIDSGLKKMGSLVGDGCQLGCNAVTNPGSIMPPNSFVVPNSTVSGWFHTKS